MRVRVRARVIDRVGVRVRVRHHDGGLEPRVAHVPAHGRADGRAVQRVDVGGQRERAAPLLACSGLGLGVRGYGLGVRGQGLGCRVRGQSQA